MVFVPNSTSFATDPRVIESVIGSVTMEHPHYLKQVVHSGFDEIF